MITSFRQKLNNRIGAFAHYFTAFVILLHGYEKMEKGEGSYWLFYVAGVLFILIAAFHHQLARRFRVVNSIFHLIEAVVLFIIAYDYFHHGKAVLPFVYLLACIGHLIAAFVKARKGRLHPQVH